MTLQRDWATKPITNTNTAFLAQLASLRIVDIGYINTVYKDGHEAEVCLCDGGQKIIAEVISVGTDKAPIVNAMPGQYVLVFYVRTPMSLQEGEVKSASLYDERYAKALPIGVTGNNDVTIIPSINSLTIGAKSYRASFGTGTVSVNSDKLALLLDCLNGKMSFGIGDTSVNISEDGAVDIAVGASYDATTGDISDAKCRLSISEDGAVELQSKGGLKIDGDVEITGSLNVADGNFTVDK